MDLSPSAQRGLVDTSRRGHVEHLLRRYPDIDAGETAEILRFVKKGPPLEAALLTADGEVRAKLQEFQADNRSEFSLGPRHYLAVAGIVAGLVAVLSLLWDVGLGR